MTTINASDLIGSGTAGSESSGNNSDSSDGGSSERESLLNIVGEMNGDTARNRVAEYLDQNGGLDRFKEFADALEGNDDLHELMEEYRQMNDQNRIHTGYLRGHEQEFTRFSKAFYGDSDDPEPGTYNNIQQRARESEGNLIFYKAVYPEPVAEYFPGEPVVWREFDTLGYGDGQQDSHIFVTREWCEEYADFTMEVDGNEVPRPPSDSEIEQAQANGGADDASADSDSDDISAPFDPSEFTVAEIPAKVEEINRMTELRALLDAEKSGDGRSSNRKGAKNAIRDRMDELEAAREQDDDSDSEPEQQSLEDASESDDGKSSAAIAGEMVADGVDMHPDSIAAMLDKGMTREEVREVANA